MYKLLQRLFKLRGVTPIWYVESKLKLSLHKCYGRHHSLLNLYRILVSYISYFGLSTYFRYGFDISVSLTLNWHWETIGSIASLSAESHSTYGSHWLNWSHHIERFTVATLTVTEYLCHKWPRICFNCRRHFPVLFSFMTYHRFRD